jgi:hypothetical protein
MLADGALIHLRRDDPYAAFRARNSVIDRGSVFIMTDTTKTEIICQRLAEGESLVAICRDVEMPSQRTVYLWLAQDEEFRKRYDEARTYQAETYFDQVAEIAKTPMIGEKSVTKADGSVEIMRGDMIEHRRLQVDALKWMAGKLRPKKYGDATLIKHADAEGNMRALDDVERFTRMASIFAEIREAKGDAG